MKFNWVAGAIVVVTWRLGVELGLFDRVVVDGLSGLGLWIVVDFVTGFVADFVLVLRCIGNEVVVEATGPGQWLIESLRGSGMCEMRRVGARRAEFERWLICGLVRIVVMLMEPGKKICYGF